MSEEDKKRAAELRTQYEAADKAWADAVTQAIREKEVASAEYNQALRTYNNSKTEQNKVAKDAAARRQETAIREVARLGFGRGKNKPDNPVFP